MGPQIRDLSTAVHTLKGLVLVFFVNVFGILFLWAELPLSRDYLLETGVFCALVVPTFTYLLFLGAWRAEQRTGGTVARLAVLEDVVFTILMIEGGGFFGYLFAVWTWEAWRDPAKADRLHFSAGGLAVCVGFFAFGWISYARRLRRGAALAPLPQPRSREPLVPGR